MQFVQMVQCCGAWCGRLDESEKRRPMDGDLPPLKTLFPRALKRLAQSLIGGGMVGALEHTVALVAKRAQL